MTAKIKKIVVSVIFLALALISVTSFVLFLINNDRVNEHMGRNVYSSTSLYRIKKGDKIEFGEINKDFNKIKNSTGNYFQVHSQDNYCLSDNLSNDSVDNMATLYIDDDGYVNAVETGVYQLEYNFTKVTPNKSESADLQTKTYTFTALICVYEDDESEYLPFPDNPTDFCGKHREKRNYILTEDVTWKGDNSFWQVEYFYGNIINPYGYTVTWEIGGTDKESKQTQSFIRENHGIINGLKLKVVSSESTAIDDDFYGIAQINYGVIENCELSGSVYIETPRTNYDPSEFFALPLHGFTFSNVVKLAVYSDNYIFAYNDIYLPPTFTSIFDNLWYSEDNKVYLDAWYYSDKVKARRRVVDTSEDNDGNICEHLLYGRQYQNSCNVTMKIPARFNQDGLKYFTYEWDAKENSPLDINFDNQDYVFRDIIDMYQHDNIEIKYWLINGEEKENLDDIIIQKNTVIEPFLQYKNTNFEMSMEQKSDGQYKTVVSGICNTEDVLNLQDYFEDQDVELSLLNLAQLFINPRNVIPSKIIVGERFDMSIISSRENTEDFIFFEEWLANGGVFEIAETNEYVSFVDGRLFCDGKGTSLYYYFDPSKEEEITLHPQVKNLKSVNTFWQGERFKKLNLSNVEKIYPDVMGALPNLEEIFIGKDTEIIWGTGEQSASKAFRALFAKTPYIRDIKISEFNNQYKEENGFVLNIEGGENLLIYAVNFLSGEIAVPEGVRSLDAKSMENCDKVTHLILPSTLENFSENALYGMSSLEKLTFGNSKNINTSNTNTVVELPKLKTIVFSDGIETLFFGNKMFSKSSLETVYLPKSLISLGGIFNSCKNFEISSENQNYKTVDGVLYETNSVSRLFAFPNKKTVSKYEVLEGTDYIHQYAFYCADIEEVVIPSTCTKIVGYCFYKSNIKKVQIKSQEILIGHEAFKESENLSEVSVEENTKMFLATSVFEDCINLKVFPYACVTAMDDKAFAGSGIESFEIGENVTSLGMQVFADSQIKEVIFSESLSISEISAYLFARTPLQTVQLGGITNIAVGAFEDCTNLKEIDLSGIITIEDRAFANNGIKRVNSETVKSIGESAFEGCKNLTTVFLSSVTNVSKRSFADSGVIGVTMPLVKKVYEESFYCAQNMTSVIFSEEVSVGVSAFEGCESLQSFDSIIQAISEKSFYGCKNIKTLSIMGVQKNAVSALSGCESLVSVNIEGGNAEIPEYFFEDCKNLLMISIVLKGEEKGNISPLSFAGVSQTVEIDLNVNENFEWSGKVPPDFIIYVPTTLVEKFKTEWLINESQLKGKEFN